MASKNYTDRFTSVLAQPLPELPRMTRAARTILDVASELFYERGIGVVGVDTIAATAGVTKKTIYDRFGAKENLVAGYLLERDTQYRAWLADWLAAHPRTSPPLAVFDGLDAWMNTRGSRGCAFVHAHAELLSTPEHPGQRVILAHKLWLRDHLRDLVQAEGARRPGELAAELLALHEGAVVLYSTAGLADAAGSARRAARTLLRAATTG